MKKSLKIKLITTILFSGSFVLNIGASDSFASSSSLPSVEINFGALKLLKAQVANAKIEEQKQRQIEAAIEAEKKSTQDRINRLVESEPLKVKDLISSSNSNVEEEPKVVVAKPRKIPKPLDFKELNVALPVKRPENVESFIEKEKDLDEVEKETAVQIDDVVKEKIAKLAKPLPEELPSEDSDSVDGPIDLAEEVIDSEINQTDSEQELADDESKEGESVFGFLDELPSFSELFDKKDLNGEDEPAQVEVAQENIEEEKEPSPDVEISEAEDLESREKISSVEIEEIEITEEDEDQIEEEIDVVEVDPEVLEEMDKNEHRISDPKEYYDLEKVQVILPKEVKKREDIVKPAPVIKPSEDKDEVIKIVDTNIESFKDDNVAQEPKPAIPEPAKIAELEEVKPKYKAIDDEEWQKILENTKNGEEAPLQNTDAVEIVAEDYDEVIAIGSKDSEEEDSEQVQDNNESDIFASVSGWFSGLKQKTEKILQSDEAEQPVEQNDEIVAQDIAVKEPEVEKIDITNELNDSAKVIEIASHSFPASLDAFEENVDLKEEELVLQEAEEVDLSISNPQKVEDDAEIPSIVPSVSLIEFEQASLPQVEEVDTQVKSLTPDENGVLFTIDFEANEIDFAEFDENRLKELSQQIAQTNNKIKIVSMAIDKEGEVNSARRVSLQRAINIRSKMIKSGLPSGKINVQALGNKDDKNVNSVMIYLIEDKTS